MMIMQPSLTEILYSASGSMYIEGLQLPLRLNRNETIDAFEARMSEENRDLFFSKNIKTLREWAKQKRRVQERESETLRWNLQRRRVTRAILSDDRIDFSALTPAPQGIDLFRTSNKEDWIYAHAHHQYDLGHETLSIVATADGFWQYADEFAANRIRDALQSDGILCSIMPERSTWTSSLESKLKHKLSELNFHVDTARYKSECVNIMRFWSQKRGLEYRLVAARRRAEQTSCTQTTTTSRPNRVLVLNLDRRPDRLESFLKSAEPHFLNIDRVSAVDGKLLNIRAPRVQDLFVTPRKEENNNTWRSVYGTMKDVGGLGAMGCAASHLRVWSDMASRDNLEDTDYWFVFEDDARLISTFQTEWKHVQNVVSNFDSNWGLIYFGFADFRDVYGDVWLSHGPHDVPKVVKLSDRPRSTGGGTFGYAVRFFFL